MNAYLFVMIVEKSRKKLKFWSSMNMQFLHNAVEDRRKLLSKSISRVFAAFENSVEAMTTVCSS